MNNIENDSTFFVSIERRKLNQNSNIRDNQSKYFLQSIKYSKNNNSKTNISISNQKTIKELPSTVLNPKKIINNIPNLKAQKNILQNKAQKKETKQNDKKLLFPEKKNLDEDLELNIDDTDEYNNIHFHINTKKPKMTLYNMSYFESKSDIDKNDKNINSNSQIIISKNYHQNIIGNKSKSCSFEKKNIEKWKLNQKIATANSKIEMLKNLRNRRAKDILELQIFFEKNNCHKKIKKNVAQSDLTGAELKKQIFKLKMDKLKCEEKYISKKQSDEEINKEKFTFSNLKAELLEKIFEYKILLMENYPVNETFNDEATIVNDSNIFDKYLNTLEDKFEKENNIIEIKNLEPKNISLNNVTEEDESLKINCKEVNCFKNKNNYFNTNFLVKAKTNNKNNIKGIYGANSQFNILINYNKIK